MGPTRRLRALAAGLTALAAAAAVAGCAPGPAGSTPPAGSPAAAVASLFDESGAAGPAVAAPPMAGPPPGTTFAAAPDPCAGNHREQYIRVDITEQHAWLCEHSHLVYDVAVTTGRSGPDTRTPTGTYQIQGRNRDTTLVPSTGEAYAVEYWIPFDAPQFGFHDSSWQRFPYGSSQYRTRGSHGCVHMPLRAMEFLYGWVDIGATVRITDRPPDGRRTGPDSRREV